MRERPSSIEIFNGVCGCQMYSRYQTEFTGPFYFGYQVQPGNEGNAILNPF